MPMSSGSPENLDTPESSMKRLRRRPASVRYARGLLWLQGGIWAWLAISGTVTTAVMVIEVLAGHREWSSAAAVVVVWLPVALLTGVFAMTKIRLAAQLCSGRDQARKTVIGIELAMT